MILEKGSVMNLEKGSVAILEKGAAPRHVSRRAQITWKGAAVHAVRTRQGRGQARQCLLPRAVLTTLAGPLSPDTRQTAPSEAGVCGLVCGAFQDENC